MTPVATSVGMYTVRDAGRLARVPYSTARRWAELGLTAAPLYRESNVGPLLTFEDLISLLTVREMRREVDLEQIKTAEVSLAKLWGVEKPFAHARIQTGYNAIVTALAQGERPVAVGAAFQEILHELIEKDLRDVSFDAMQQAREWQPAQYVLVAPSRQFGQPCVEGTRITTRTVHQFISGGDSYEDLAEDLRVEVPKLKAAYAYEESLFKRVN